VHFVKLFNPLTANVETMVSSE